MKQESFSFDAGVRAQEATVGTDAGMVRLVGELGGNKVAAILLGVPEPSMTRKLKYEERQALSYREAVKLLMAAPREAAKDALAPLVLALGCKELEDAPPTAAERELYTHYLEEQVSENVRREASRKAKAALKAVGQ